MTKVISPCVRNCCLNEKDICLGCFRHIDEILIWSKTLENEKRTIVERAQKRKKDHKTLFEKNT